MPCSCDGYEDDRLSRIADRADRLEKELCRARAIIHQILQGHGRTWDGPLKKKAENEVRLLLEHKREEIGRDIERAKMERQVLRQRVQKIEELGGSPNALLLDEVAKLDAEIARITQLTDEELLG